MEFELTKSSTEDVSQLLSPLLQAHVTETGTILSRLFFFFRGDSLFLLALTEKLYPKGGFDRGSTCS